MRCSIASRLRCRPVRVGNSGSVGVPPRSVSHAVSVSAVSVVIGVTRCFRPFPTHRMFAAAPRVTSLMVNEISSEIRNPVCAVSTSMA